MAVAVVSADDPVETGCGPECASIANKTEDSGDVLLDQPPFTDYASCITKPPEGLGVRLASAGPFFVCCLGC